MRGGSAGQPARELEVRRRAVEQHDARLPSTRDAGLGERGLRAGARLDPVGERAGLRRGRQRPAVHALHEPLGGELAQVAPDRVLGHAQLVDEPRGDDLAVAVQDREDRLPALGGEKPLAARSCMDVHGTAWLCAGRRA